MSPTRLLLHLPQLLRHLHPLALQLVHLWWLAHRRACCWLPRLARWPLLGGRLLLVGLLRGGCRRALASGSLLALLCLWPRHALLLAARKDERRARERAGTGLRSWGSCERLPRADLAVL